MSTTNYLEINDRANGIRTITLNRPEVHNAFDDAMIGQLHHAFNEANTTDHVRIVILAANGKSFSAGADLAWMRRMADYSEQQNVDDAMALADLLARLHKLNKPTIAKVQGPAFGGGVGLLACCDIVVACPEASFCFSEVKIGLIPAVISPYIIAAMGAKQAKRFFLTAERFSADTARHSGLVDEIVASTQLDSHIDTLCSALLANGPVALAQAKCLVHEVQACEINPALLVDTAKRIAHIRISPEGQEGLNAFLEKRQPNWKLTHAE